MPIVFIILSLAGVIDASYLTWEHYAQIIPPCSTVWWLSDCGKVLTSSYSIIYGIPLAAIGVFFYTIELIFAIGTFFKKRWARRLLIVTSLGGFVSSVIFVYLMLGVIRAICWYCMGSALISTIMFFLVWKTYPRDITWWLTVKLGILYRHILKPILFLFDPEIIHESMVSFGQRLGTCSFVRKVSSLLFIVKDKRLSQIIAGISFSSPVGLAAGFDYEARLTQILGPIGFGFQSVGTITNNPYEGNVKPMLGRLPHSKSLMVNKGFKNFGASETIKRLKKETFTIPVGVSVGRTNSRTSTLSQSQSVADICEAFITFEKSGVPFSYYELNISCPNLHGSVNFYKPSLLDELLTQIDKLKLTKPVFVKMPIEKPDKDFRAMLQVINKHSPVGIIVGNLQKNRKNPVLDPKEVAKFPVGFFSGKPTLDDSNRLIELTYRKFSKRFVIIGCGGIFSGADAFEKIKRGASLVQLITGMIYEGPQLPSRIALDLIDILEDHEFSSIQEAVGSDVT